MVPRDSCVNNSWNLNNLFTFKREIKVADRTKFHNHPILILEYYPGLSSGSSVIRMTLEVEEEGRLMKSE